MTQENSEFCQQLDEMIKGHPCIEAMKSNPGPCLDGWDIEASANRKNCLGYRCLPWKTAPRCETQMCLDADFPSWYGQICYNPIKDAI